MIVGLSHVALTVSDLEKSIPFYKKTLGFTVLSDAERKGEWVEKITGIPGFHTRTVYLASTLYRHLEMFGFFYPPVIPSERGTELRVGISHCVLRREGEEKKGSMKVDTLQDPDGMTYKIIDSKGKKNKNSRESTGEFLFPALIVEEIEKSLVFYRDVLGLEVEKTSEDYPSSTDPALNGISPKGKWALLKAQTGICLQLIQPLHQRALPANSWQMQRTGFTHLAFGVKDLDSIYSKMGNKNIHFKAAPQSVRVGPHQGGKAAYLNLPDGLTLEFIESPLISEELKTLASQ